MKRKSRYALSGEDSRAVAIYTRKSRITNKGDSIGVQFKQSADYARNQLSLAEDYSFLRYEDKGLSGYYSDRPDFQRLLRDIEMGKIRAVACYKLDRISRKTSDLMRLLEYFERHDVTLLVCSNNINTQISTSKIIIQVLAIIAEFERDILTERIQDNLMELAKDGRWLGGATPTGFSSKRVSTGSGKNKSAVSFLVSIDGEKALVQKIYRTFMRTRSLMATSNASFRSCSSKFSSLTNSIISPTSQLRALHILSSTSVLTFPPFPSLATDVALIPLISRNVFLFIPRSINNFHNLL